MRFRALTWLSFSVPLAVENFMSEVVSSTEVSLSWTTSDNGDQAGFTLTYTDETVNGSPVAEDVPSEVGENSFSFTLIDLFPGHRYQITIVAYSRPEEPLPSITRSTTRTTCEC